MHILNLVRCALQNTQLENWFAIHAGDMKKIQRGEIDIPAVQGGRKTRKTGANCGISWHICLGRFIKSLSRLP